MIRVLAAHSSRIKKVRRVMRATKRRRVRAEAAHLQGMTNNNNRKPAGRPDGGEFAPHKREDADVELMELTLDDIFLSTLTLEEDEWLSDEQWERREQARLQTLRENAQGKMFPLAGESAFEGVSGRPEIRGYLSIDNTPQM